ncbi:MAG: hypothetical protein J3K34DRAFT_419940 [Monoraphidium minutum]|nr:MAG: hypothetical protein J3K34DRAFT_419940 [Monoraphidium minutum]
MGTVTRVPPVGGGCGCASHGRNSGRVAQRGAGPAGQGCMAAAEGGWGGGRHCGTVRVCGRAPAGASARARARGSRGGALCGDSAAKGYQQKQVLRRLRCQRVGHHMEAAPATKASLRNTIEVRPHLAGAAAKPPLLGSVWLLSYQGAKQGAARGREGENERYQAREGRCKGAVGYVDGRPSGIPRGFAA